jgi:hypothetical protein
MFLAAGAVTGIAMIAMVMVKPGLATPSKGLTARFA